VERSVSAFMEELSISTGFVVSRALARLLAAVVMTRSLKVANWLERHLCLKNAAPKIRVAHVVVDQNF
jgi:hypothetical protein